MSEFLSSLSFEMLLLIIGGVGTTLGSVISGVMLWVLNKWSEERTYRALTKGIEDFDLLDSDDLETSLRPLVVMINRNNKFVTSCINHIDLLNKSIKSLESRVKYLEEDRVIMMTDFNKMLSNIK
mgnify:CR=1 FL=1